MSKFWLLLLFIAVVQFGHSYPTAEYEVDEYTSDEAGEYMSDETDAYLSDEEIRGSFVIETWNKLKDKYKKIGTVGAKEVIAVLNNRYCGQKEDFEGDYHTDEVQDKVSDQYKLVLTLKELYEKANAKWGHTKDKLIEALTVLRKKFCVKLNEVQQESDFYEDEEEDGGEELLKFGPGEVFSKIAEGATKTFKIVSSTAEQTMKNGATFLKNMGVKITPLQCEEKTCKGCAIFRIPNENSFCLNIRFLKTNIATYLVIAGEINQTPKFEEKFKLGEMPRCLDVGGFIGKICFKAVEGRAKSSSGQANVNFCLGALAEKFGVGCKFCATYANKKLQVKVVPTTFAGAMSVDGDMVQLDQNGKDATTLDAEEFEVD